MSETPAPPPGYRMQSADTSYWAERRMLEEWGRMAPHEKWALVTALCRAAHRMSLAGLRSSHPNASEEELELRAAALRVGADVVEQITGRRFDEPA